MKVKQAFAIAVVIVNFRSGEYVCRCLDTLKDEIPKLPSTQVIIIDNASSDGSVQLIQEKISANHWDAWARVVVSGYNGGFSFGNNYIVRSLLQSRQPPKYFMLLNPDTLVLSGAIRILYNFLENHSPVGITGGQLERMDGSIKCLSGRRFPSPFSELTTFWYSIAPFSKILNYFSKKYLSNTEAHPTDWVTGANCMIRSSVFRDIGLMDEVFFLYFEDVDICMRAKQKKWEVWHIPQSRIRHQGGGSTQFDFESFTRPEIWFCSRKRYFLKHYGYFGLIAANFFRLISFLTVFPFLVAQGRDSEFFHQKDSCDKKVRNF